MPKYAIFIVTFYLLKPVLLTAQAMDNTVSYRDIPGSKYFRINYENDFFTASDRDYTQGILIEKVHPAFSRFPFMRVLLHPANSDLKYGLAIEHNAYTPNRIDKYAIQYGDRPYAGVLLFKTFLIASNFDRGRRISVSFNAGLIGPVAGPEGFRSDSDFKIHCFTFSFFSIEKSTISLFLLSVSPFHLPAGHSTISTLIFILIRCLSVVVQAIGLSPKSSQG